jgi:hypothetical protein
MFIYFFVLIYYVYKKRKHSIKHQFEQVHVKNSIVLEFCQSVTIVDENFVYNIFDQLT